MLSGIEHVPSEDDWRRLGEGALPVLIDLYSDESEPGFVRIRAVSASAAFPQQATHTFLLAVAHADGQSDLFIREAVLALGRAFGRAAVGDIAPFLRHEASVVREASAMALGRIGGSDATGALRAQLSVERDAAVRTSIERALR